MLRGESPLSPSLDVRLGLRLTGNLHCRVHPSAYGSHSSVFLEGKVFENAAPGKTVQTRSRVRDSAQAHAGTHAIAQASRLRDGLGLVPGQRGACHQAAWSSRRLPQDTPSPKLEASLTPQTPLSRVRLAFLLVSIGWVWDGTEMHSCSRRAPGNQPAREQPRPSPWSAQAAGIHQKQP